MTMQGDKMKRMMERVRNLLAIADHPNTPGPEAETARMQAEALMFKYRIDAANMDGDEKAAAALTPEWREFVVCPYGSEFQAHYVHIVRGIVSHLDCEAQFGYGEGSVKAFVVGYEADLQVFDILQAEATAQFGKRLEPQYHRDETDAQNALRMRQGGMERNRIGVILFGASDTVNEMKAKNRRVTRLIKEEAARTGVDANLLLGRGNNIKTYRTSFANAFAWEFTDRLRRMASQRSTEGTIVLGNRKEAIKEALYVRYPHLRPTDRPRLEGGETARAKCAKCKGAKSGYCREHSYLKPSTARPRSAAYSSAGHRAGVAAAQAVNIGTAGRQAVGR